jgi:hypothetical protein
MSALRHKTPVTIVASLALASASTMLSAPAYGAQTNAAKTETRSETDRTAESPRSGGIQRPVEVVVVWGFRLRSTIQDLRRDSLREGYGDLINKAVCLSSVCGFVVVPDGNRWRTSNVLSGTEAQLQELQRNMERDNTTLVIVHPTGQRRAVPDF